MGMYEDIQNRRNGMASGSAISSFNNKYGLSSPAAQTSLRRATEAGVPRGFGTPKVPKTSSYTQARSTPGGGAAPRNSIGLASSFNTQAPAQAPTSQPVVKQQTEIDPRTAPALDPRAREQQAKDRDAAVRVIANRMMKYNLDRNGARQFYEDQGFGELFDELITDDLDLTQYYGYGFGG